MTIFFHICPYAHMPICLKYAHNGHMGIWAYVNKYGVCCVLVTSRVTPNGTKYAHNGHMGICEKIWSSGVSPKRASKMRLRDVDLRSVGPSVQKLGPKTFFAKKSLVFYIITPKK